LDLPPLNEGGAPIPPRLYNKLYSHLDQVLEAATPHKGRSTPGRARLGGASAKSSPSAQGRPLPSRPVPDAARSLAQFRNPSARHKDGSPPISRRKHVSHSTSDVNSLPPWIQPTLASIAQDLRESSLAPIAMAGVRAVLFPHGKRNDAAWLNEDLAGVLCTVFLYVWTSAETLRDPNRGKMERSRYAAMRRQVLDAMSRARKHSETDPEGERRAGRGAGMSEKEQGMDGEKWAGWKQPSSDALDKMMTTLNKVGFLEGDWTTGIADIVREDQDDEAGEVGEGNAESEDPPALVRARKPDTMLQDRYDYISPQRRLEYARWKKGIMERIRSAQREKSDMILTD
jgi:origin recognition complex subunit 6